MAIWDFFRVLLANAPRGLAEAGKAIAWLAHRTGLPSLILAAAALVLTFRLARRAGRIAVEFTLALVVLFALSRLGLTKW